MTKRTRVFLMTATGILTVGLGTGLVAAYMGGFQNLVLIGTEGPAELAYVPSDARVLAYADVRDIMNSEVRRKVQEAQQKARAGSTPPEDGIARFKQETGIDLETDVDHVVAASDQTLQAGRGRPLLLARGAFDAVNIEGLIEGLVRQHGGQAEDYKGKQLFTHAGNEFALAFLESDLIAVGTPASVRRAIDTKESGQGTVRDNADVMRLVRDIDNGNAWAIARMTEAGANLPILPGNVSQQIPPLNWVAISAQINAGIDGAVRAEAKDDAAAQNLREVIRGFIALARLQSGQQTQVTELLNSLQLSGEGTSVQLGFSVPPQLFDTLTTLRAARPRVPAPGQQPTPQRTPRRPAPAAPTL
jgi:hypothetical protein